MELPAGTPAHKTNCHLMSKVPAIKLPFSLPARMMSLLLPDSVSHLICVLLFAHTPPHTHKQMYSLYRCLA